MVVVNVYYSTINVAGKFLARKRAHLPEPRGACSLQYRRNSAMLMLRQRRRAKAVQGPTLRDTLSFVRRAYARAGTDGHRRWTQAMAAANLLPTVLPGIAVTLAERQVALLRDVFRTTLETEESLLDAGFSNEVVASVLLLTRFDVGFDYLEHLGVVAQSRDLTAKRVAMAVLLREERQAEDARWPDTAEARDRRRKAMEIMRRGLGY